MSHLVTAAALAAELAGPGPYPVLLDATVRREAATDGTVRFADGREGFAAGHLPGARFADLVAAFSEPSDLPFTRPSPQRLQAAARALGLHAGTRVVACDADTGAWAARLWWLLRGAGLADVRVLDGGLTAWRAAGLPVETGPGARCAPGSLEVAGDDPRFLPLEGVRDLVGRPDPRRPLLCGVRRSEYRGDAGGPRAGHLPGSRALPYGELLAADGTLDPARTRAAVAELGLGPDDVPVLYCGGGINAAGLALALAEVGVDEVQLYDGSLTEWRARPELPLVTGPDPW